MVKVIDLLPGIKGLLPGIKGLCRHFPRYTHMLSTDLCQNDLWYIRIILPVRL